MSHTDMGFFLRKSFAFGPFRLNLSNKGVGGSVGVRGFRLGSGARGDKYVRIGRGGLYYQQTLTSEPLQHDAGGYRRGLPLTPAAVLAAVALLYFTASAWWAIVLGAVAIVAAVWCSVFRR